MEKKKKFALESQLILKAVALGMGVAVATLAMLGTLVAELGIGMLGIGLACLAATALGKNEDQ